MKTHLRNYHRFKDWPWQDLDTSLSSEETASGECLQTAHAVVGAGNDVAGRMIGLVAETEAVSRTAAGLVPSLEATEQARRLESQRLEEERRGLQRRLDEARRQQRRLIREAAKARAAARQPLGFWKRCWMRLTMLFK